MYNDRHLKSIVLIIVLLVLSGLIAWRITIREEVRTEQVTEETIQRLLEEARNRSTQQNIENFEEARVTSGYDPVNFGMAVRLFDRLGRDRKPASNLDDIYDSRDSLYVEVTVFEFATKDMSLTEKAGNLTIDAETTKEGVVIEEMSKTLYDSTFKIQEANAMIFYEELFENAQPGEYTVTITATDGVSSVKTREVLDFTLQ